MLSMKPINDGECYGCRSLHFPLNAVHQNVCYFYQKKYLGCPCQECLVKGLCEFECALFRKYVEGPKQVIKEKGYEL